MNNGISLLNDIISFNSWFSVVILDPFYSLFVLLFLLINIIHESILHLFNCFRVFGFHSFHSFSISFLNSIDFFLKFLKVCGIFFSSVFNFFDDSLQFVWHTARDRMLLAKPFTCFAIWSTSEKEFNVCQISEFIALIDWNCYVWRRRIRFKTTNKASVTVKLSHITLVGMGCTFRKIYNTMVK